MIVNKILAIGIVIPILILSAPNVYARNLTDTQRYNDGYSNGSDAAARDSTYNVACDPTGAYTSGGGHTTTYCNGWTNGYIATWNTNHPGSSTINTPPNTYAPPSQGNGPNYSGVCQTVQPVIIQSCSTLVNSDGSLTTDGTHAMNCIKNGVLLGGGATLLGLPLPLVLKGLSILSAPTGCDGIVDMSAFNSLGNIGSISSLLNSLP
jgi:hypothetical protein